KIWLELKEPAGLRHNRPNRRRLQGGCRIVLDCGDHASGGENLLFLFAFFAFFAPFDFFLFLVFSRISVGHPNICPGFARESLNVLFTDDLRPIGVIERHVHTARTLYVDRFCLRVNLGELTLEDLLRLCAATRGWAALFLRWTARRWTATRRSALRRATLFLTRC